MVLFGSGEPYAVISGAMRFVAQQENDFLPNVNGEAAKHRTGHWRKRGDSIKHEFMGNRFSRFEAEWKVACRGTSRMALRHR